MKRIPASVFAWTLVLVGLVAVRSVSAQDFQPGKENPRCRHCGRPLVGMSGATDPLTWLRPWKSQGRNQCCPTPGAAMNADGTPVQGAAPAMAADGSPLPAADGTSLGNAASSGAGQLSLTSGAGAIPGISLGDASPFVTIHAGARLPVPPTPPGPPGPPGPTGPPRSPSLALVRGFKIADNQTPQPVDRVFFTYNFFDYINNRINRDFQVPITRMRAYRALFGFEKTFFDKDFSIGVRLPINTLTADSVFPPTPTRTALGDLNVYSKYVLWRDTETNSLLTAGLALTLPTGPRTFANAPYIRSLHNFELQPYLGYQRTWGNLFLIGFEAINVPTAIHDVTVLYNDWALGYQFYKTDEKTAFIRGVSANFEVHANIPLNHRDVFNSQDVVGTADVVDLTYGVNFRIGQNALASFGVVTPVTGPRPFSIEALAILNIFSY